MQTALSLMLIASLSAASGELDIALANKEWARAETLAREETQRTPKDPASWQKLTLALQGLRRYDDALSALAEAKKQGAPVMWLLTREARLRALKGDTEGSFLAMTQAAKLGFPNATLLDTDPELANLRRHTEFATLRQQVDRNANPCQYQPESKQFDFWVGEWDVTSAGAPAGTSKVEKILNGCVLQENWTSAGGSTGGGKSFNLYDPEQKRWRQTWVDAGGRITDYAGGLDKEGRMVFTAHDAWPVSKVHLRMTFTRLNENQVRQLIETSKDRKRWSVAFDGLYTRR